MDYREKIYFAIEKERQERNKVPVWAQAEHMEQSVPLKELWNYSDSFEPAKKPAGTLLRRIKGFRKKKTVDFCHGAEELSRIIGTKKELAWEA